MMAGGMMPADDDRCHIYHVMIILYDVGCVENSMMVGVWGTG